MLKDAAAAITLFTRIPLWKVVKIEKQNYDNAVVFWPLAGWVTAGIAATCIILLSFVMPTSAAVMIAVAARVMLTGALHEDGLADFCDGFGGGYEKEKILAIMKDSHIGTYGTIGLIVYFLLLTAILSSLPPATAALAILAADPFCKLCAGQLTNFLSYARPEGAKNKTSYRKMNRLQILATVIAGIIPATPLLALNPSYSLAAIFPFATFILLSIYMRRKIGGYTGDCCGATFLICETSMLTAILIISNLR